METKSRASRCASPKLPLATSWQLATRTWLLPRRSWGDQWDSAPKVLGFFSSRLISFRENVGKYGKLWKTMEPQFLDMVVDGMVYQSSFQSSMLWFIWDWLHHPRDDNRNISARRHGWHITSVSNLNGSHCFSKRCPWNFPRPSRTGSEKPYFWSLNPEKRAAKAPWLLLQWLRSQFLWPDAYVSSQVDGSESPKT